jgi:hypothetical protein
MNRDPSNDRSAWPAHAPAPNPEAAVWSLLRDGKTLGPFRLAELRELAAAGVMTSATMLRHVDGRTLEAAALAIFERPIDPVPAISKEETAPGAQGVTANWRSAKVGGILWGVGLAGYALVELAILLPDSWGMSVRRALAFLGALPPGFFLAWLCRDIEHHGFGKKDAAASPFRSWIPRRSWMWGALPLVWLTVLRPLLNLLWIVWRHVPLPPALDGLGLAAIYCLPLAYLMEVRPRLALQRKSTEVGTPASGGLRRPLFSGSIIAGVGLIVLGTILTPGLTIGRGEQQAQPRPLVLPGAGSPPLRPDPLDAFQRAIAPCLTEYDAVVDAGQTLLQRSRDGLTTPESEVAELTDLVRRLSDVTETLDSLPVPDAALAEARSLLLDGFRARGEVYSILRQMVVERRDLTSAEQDTIAREARAADAGIQAFQNRMTAVRQRSGTPEAL